MVIIPVAAEKLGFPEKSQKSGDSKCLRASEKSFVDLPDAIQFLQILSERVFQHPPLFATVIQRRQAIAKQSGRPKPRFRIFVIALHGGLLLQQFRGQVHLERV